MSTMANNLPLISVSLLCAWLVTGIIFHFSKFKTMRPGNRFIFVLLVFALIRFAPVYDGMSVAHILRGILGDLSITTMLLFLTFLYSEIRGCNSCYKINNALWLLIFIIGLTLCLSVFGCIPFDIYASGYFPKGLLIFYLITQALFRQLNKKFTIFWLLALVGYIFKVLPSPNLWDYLIDPVLWLVSLVCLIVFGFLKIKNRTKFLNPNFRFKTHYN